MGLRILAASILVSSLAVCFTFRNEYIHTGVGLVVVNRVTGEGRICKLPYQAWECSR